VFQTRLRIINSRNQNGKRIKEAWTNQSNSMVVSAKARLALHAKVLVALPALAALLPVAMLRL